MKFLPRGALEEFYTKVVLPSVLYGQIPWSSSGRTHLDCMERLHERAARVVHRQPWDAEAYKVLTTAGWPTLDTLYKRKLLTLAHRAQHDKNIPQGIKDMSTKKKPTYSLRRAQTLEIPRAVTIWNSPPNEYRILNNTDNFKRH